MKELFDDVRELLLADPRLDYVKRAGGVFELQSFDQFPHQHKLPAIVLTEDGVGEIKHWSSRRRWMGFRLQIHVVQQVFDRQGMIAGKKGDRSVHEMAKDVRFVVDMDRIGGKYARFLLIGEDKANTFEDGNMFLLEKSLTFDVARIE